MDTPKAGWRRRWLYSSYMGRGQSSTLTAPASAQRTVTPARRANAVNPEMGEIVELCARGGVVAQAENKLDISHEDFLLLAAMEKALKDSEQESITAHELSVAIGGPDARRLTRELHSLVGQNLVAPESGTSQAMQSRLNEIDSHRISRRLRLLTEAGHVTASYEKKAYRWSLAHSLDDFYPWQRIFIPGARARKFESAGVRLNRYSNNSWISVERDDPRQEWGYMPGVETEAFVSGAQQIAGQVLKGKTQTFQLVACAHSMGDRPEYLAMFPYRVGKGRRQEPMIAFKFVTLDGATNLSWEGVQWEDSFLNGVVSAKDLLETAKLLSDRRATECGR